MSATIKRPPIGARVRVTEKSLGVRGWIGVVDAHHVDGVCVRIRLGAQRPGAAKIPNYPADVVLLEPGMYEVMP